MAKATVTSGAAAQADAKPNLKRVTDENGRSIAVRTDYDVIDEMRLLKMLGGENSAYFNFCAQLSRVVEIGGEAVTVPNSEREFQLLGKRLGRAGINALGKLFSGEDDGEGDGKASAEADAAERETVKK